MVAVLITDQPRVACHCCSIGLRFETYVKCLVCIWQVAVMGRSCVANRQRLKVECVNLVLRGGPERLNLDM